MISDDSLRAGLVTGQVTGKDVEEQKGAMLSGFGGLESSGG